MGQSRSLFAYFRPLLITISTIQFEKHLWCAWKLKHCRVGGNSKCIAITIEVRLSLFEWSKGFVIYYIKLCIQL